MKSLFCKSIKLNLNTINQNKSIISPIKKYIKTSNTLNLIINDVLENEKKLYEPIEKEEISSFLRRTRFEFNVNSSKFEMRKIINDFDVKIYYFTPDILPVKSESHPKEVISGNMIDLNIIIKKRNDSNGILVEAFVADSKILINNLYIHERIDFFYKNIYKNKSINKECYQGPDFKLYEESLQIKFYDFLKDLQINDDLARFIFVTAFDQEERLYSNWLEKIKELL